MWDGDLVKIGAGPDVLAIHRLRFLLVAGMLGKPWYVVWGCWDRCDLVFFARTTLMKGWYILWVLCGEALVRVFFLSGFEVL